MQPPEDLAWWVKAGLYAAFAALGGLLGHIMRAMDNKEPIRFLRAACEGVAAGFVGLIVMLLCMSLGLSDQWTGVIVGVCGWLGASTTIRVLEEPVYTKLGIRRRKADKETDDV